MRYAAAAATAAIAAALTVTASAWASPIPDQAREHQRHLTRAVQAHHGLSGPVALHAAIVHQESSWRPDARSPVGAKGLAQFMPVTAGHVEELLDADGFDPMNPRQAITGMARYTAWLKRQVDPWGDGGRFDHWSMVLSAYNGGLGWVRRDREQAREDGRDPDRWFCHVESAQTRSDDAQQENRDYVRAVLLRHQADYLEAGWRGPRVSR